MRGIAQRVLEHSTGPDLIARCAAGEDIGQPSMSSPPLDANDSDMSYADWRAEVLGLIHVEF